jgi:hypothetical protein
MRGRDVVLIIGSGRSGTSALTRVLSLSGCTLPASVIGASNLNPRGFWEPVEALRLNLEFMHRHGGRWADPTMRLQETAIAERDRERYVEKIVEFLRACPDGAALLVKHTDISELMPFWLEAARRDGLSAKVIICIRDPREVFLSSREFRVVPVELFNACWLKRNLLAERESREVPRVVVEYANLLRDWRAEVGRISSALLLDLKPEEASIDAFLSRDLHRKRASGPIVETFGYPWISQMYAILSAAAEGEPIDCESMEDIYRMYVANERAFRIALEACDSIQRDVQALQDSTEMDSVGDAPLWRLGRDF